MSNVAPLPFSIDQCRQAAVIWSDQYLGLPDTAVRFSPETLALVDAHIDRKRGAAIDGPLFGDLIMAGAYVGEVLIDQVGGRWVKTGGSPLRGGTQMPYVVRLDNGAWVNALEKPYKCFQDDQQTMVAFYSAFSSPGAGGAVKPKPFWKIWG